jgi:thioredoxin reductase
MYDAIIAGGGPAGLSAALVLGRCRRRVVVCDAGRPRNAASSGLHGYLTRDGIHPAELLRLGREEAGRYGVDFEPRAIVNAYRCDGGFESVLDDSTRISGRTLLLSTGVVDRVPPIPGIDQFYGSSVFHCPYCDGWEMRDQPLAVVASGRRAAGLAVELLQWSGDVVVASNGSPRLSAAELGRLESRGIPVFPQRIAALEGSGGVLERIRFAGGEHLARRGIFFSNGQVQRSDLAIRLGCRFNEKGTVRTNLVQGTGVEGLYVAGDAARDVQFAIVAAAEGAKAAFAINSALSKLDRP